MTTLVEFLRARVDLRYRIWQVRNVWAWPGVFQIGCWWEKRYRPERWQWKEGAVLLSSGRATTRRPGETWAEAMNRLTEGDDL